MKTEDTLLVSVNFSGEGVGVLLVGRKKKKQAVDIINAFQGEDAKKIYEMLVTKKEESKEE